MKQILTDKGTEYNHKLMHEICELMKISHLTSTAYRHQTVGTVERNHRVLNEYMRAYFDGNFDEWERQIDYFTFCYNISKNTNFNFKYSPYELVFGKNVNMPHDLFSDTIAPLYNIDNFAAEFRYRLQTAHKTAEALIEKCKIRNKNIYDKKSIPIYVEIGDKVLLENEPYKKHQNKYSGPFEIIAIDGHNVVLSIKNKLSTVHKDRIRKIS